MRIAVQVPPLTFKLQRFDLISLKYMITYLVVIMRSNITILLGAAITAGLLFAIVVSVVPSAAQPAENNNTSAMQARDSTFTVNAGGGGPETVSTSFSPSRAEIKAGETVMWVNPTKVGEPHTVTFFIDNNTRTDFAVPFVLGNGSANLTPAIPNANAEPIVMPGPNGSRIVIGVNDRSISPTIIHAKGNVTHLAPNANYTMDGTEKYMNSGWMWPQGQVPPGLPPVNSFSVKFTKAGTYSYLCDIHPWMRGEVVVK
jgi:plastocyanin